MQNMGSIKLLCDLLKQKDLEHRLNLVNEVLLFGISLLLGGHEKNQNDILQILTNDTDNIML